MEYRVTGARATVKLAVAMMAAALLLPLGFRVIHGAAPSRSCYERVSLGADAYLRQTKEVYVLAGAVLAGALVMLSVARRQLDGRRASPGAETLVAVGVAAAATAAFLAEPSLFVTYFLAAVGLASWIALIAIAVMAARAGSQARHLNSPDPWLRWGQMVGWYLLTVVLPVSFVFIAPWGPLCLD